MSTMCPDRAPMYEIDGSPTGLPVPPDDTPSAASASACLLTDKPLWHAVVERARAYMFVNFNPRDWVQVLEERYYSILEGRS